MKMIRDAIGDWLWDLATSDLALLGIAVLLAACFVVSRLPILRRLPATAPYVVLAGFLVYVLLADLALCIGFRIADERAETKSLRTQIVARDRDIETANKAARDADAARAELARQAEQDQERIEDYEERLRKRPMAAGDKSTCGCVLVPDDFDGLRDNRRRAR